MLQASQTVIVGRGTNTTFLNTRSSQRAAVFVPYGLSDPTLVERASEMAVALENLCGSVRVNASQFLPEVVPQNNRAAVINGGTRKAFMAFQTAAIDFRQAADKAMAVAMTPIAATSATQMIRGRAVKHFDAADIAGKAAMIQSFTLEQLSGLVDAGALDALPNDLATIARDQFMILAHVARAGLQANFQRQASAADPLASGADVDAAMAASKASLDALKARFADVDAAANVLRSIVTAVALICEITIDDAYAVLTSAAIAN
ncbi:hypothetical protein [Bradyrhizobium sp. AUGA SZCCT0431]|uniref:hypothetical protein n=1 Tax=Bradyrhizobium sp. AUGA SZCCT0431 TaxID=2807674 RepID=UPI001BA7995C|nr:hypothetical protein [Bradyrhizobium sp. AUGA SZCCT0431]MBR1143688.1 hypothetical protein [Bradyrhizobium sp. AUGA SZCCT0431]